MKRGFFIARFQPVHKDHIKVLRKISRELDELIIGVGSSEQAYTIDNPFTAKERTEMLNSTLKIKNYTITPIPDINNYSKWVKHVESIAPKFDIVYSGNKIVKDLFKKAGYAVKDFEHGKKRYISGTAIRDMMAKGEAWQKYVPEEVAKIIDDIKGAERIKALYEKQKYKNPAPTVDIIIELEKGIVLIERKNFPFGWAIPGGFINYGESAEEAAIREAKEETSLDIKIVKLLGVYSKPDRDPRLHTISTVFIAKAEGKPKADDDAKNLKIFAKENLPETLAFDHKKILEDYFHAKNNT